VRLDEALQNTANHCECDRIEVIESASALKLCNSVHDNHTPSTFNQSRRFTMKVTTKIMRRKLKIGFALLKSNRPTGVAVISAKNHKRQRRKRQSVTAKREKSQTPEVLTAILTLPNLT